MGDLIADCTDETLLELLASASGGSSEAREGIAMELAYRMGVLREIAHLHAERTLIMSQRGTDASLLASAETDHARDIVTVSRSLLDNRRGERNVRSRLKSHLTNLEDAVGRMQAHVESVRRIEEELRTGSEGVVRKIGGGSRARSAKRPGTW